MRRGLLLALFSGALYLGVGAGVATAQPTDAPATTSVAPGKDGFKAAELEELRYRHLWIGYGAIWLIIFGFVWRTWKRGNETASELDDLRRRLAELESRNG